MTDWGAPDGKSTALRVLVVVEDAPTLRVIQRTLGSAGDEVITATDLADAMASAGAEVPDLVLIDVGMGQEAGLAMVHHLRALAPNLAVAALIPAESLGLVTQAMALGASHLLVLPLSGDELLMTASAVRTRRAERAQQLQLAQVAELARSSRSLSEALSGLASAASRRDAAERLAVLLAQAGASSAMVYVPAGEGARQLMRLGAVGNSDGSPAFCEDLEVLSYAQSMGMLVHRVTLERQTQAILLIAPGVSDGFSALVAALPIVSSSIGLALALVGEREHATRGAMKDPRSSAYTFAYFVDVTGREIDKARRYQRRFALATLSVESRREGRQELSPEAALEVAERVLSCVRDTDVLARVDETEFYLLLPETGGTGAHTCRRRIVRQLIGAGGLRSTATRDLELAIGVATFPQDGVDLSQLLRVARHRADSSRNSTVQRLGLDRMPLPEILDALLWQVDDPSLASDPLAPRTIQLPMMEALSLAVSAVQEAARAGETRVVSVTRGGMSLGGAIRASLGSGREGLSFENVELSAHSAFKDLEVLVVIAEHGAYCLLGRQQQGQLRAVHAPDPLLADIVVQRLGEAIGARLLD